MPLTQIPLGNEAAVYFNDTELLVDLDNDGLVAPIDLTLWFAGLTISRDVRDVSVVASQQFADVTPRERARHGHINQWPLPRAFTVNISIIGREWDGQGTIDLSERGALQQRLIESWDNWDALSDGVPAGHGIPRPLGMAFMDREVAPRQGICGNFWPTLSKSELIRGLQLWQVALIPHDYVQWVEQTIVP